jgi:LacI family transcriptional regulator
VGFDDLPPALVTFPFLTVASQPAYEMGRKGVEVLLDRLNHRPPKRFREIVLPTTLIVRQSSGPAILKSRKGN